MTKQEQSEKIVYGSLITSTKCYNCIHFPLCFAQKGGANLELASENDCCYYQSKLPENSVVLSGEEYEMLVNQYKNLEIKYSNLCDNYRLCKDANETLKQNIIITRKEIAEKFYDKVNENICVFQLENKNQEFTDGYAQAIADICGRLDQVAKQFGVEIKEQGCVCKISIGKSITSNEFYIVINDDLYVEISEQQFNSVATLLEINTKEQWDERI